jgi:hypothetical protein
MVWLARQWARQTIEDFELIVIDSTEDDEQRMKTLRVLTDHLGPRVHYVSTEDNVVPEKYDLAVDMAQGRFVVLAGDDDWQSPRRLERSLDAIQRHGAVEWAGFLNSGVFTSMVKRQVSVHNSPLPPASTMIVRTEVAKMARFASDMEAAKAANEAAPRPEGMPPPQMPNLNIASDTRWSNQVMDSSIGVLYPKGLPLLSIWFRHSKNITAASGAPCSAHFGFDQSFAEFSAALDGWDDIDTAEYEELVVNTMKRLGLDPRIA